jgi:hypothetical protein
MQSANNLISFVQIFAQIPRLEASCITNTFTTQGCETSEPDTCPCHKSEEIQQWSWETTGKAGTGDSKPKWV